MVKLKIEVINKDDSGLLKLYGERKNLDGDAGMDLYFTGTQIVMSEETNLISLGIKAEMTFISAVGAEELPQSFYVVPRSSIYRTPLRMSNSIGVIDSGYRGELMVPVDNMTDEDYYIEKEERLFQIIHPTLQSFEVEMVTGLSSTKRGEGGFGSTGK
tara:strand:+ start:30 stop:503 length:474 start_codon:yes stop_codon:yes gene_type:complete